MKLSGLLVLEKKVGLSRGKRFVENKKVIWGAFLSTLQIDGSKLLAFH